MAQKAQKRAVYLIIECYYFRMGQSDHSRTKNIAVILFLIAVLITGYILYRYHTNPSQYQIAHISGLAQFPSSKCSFSAGNFAGAAAGVVYIAGGKLREDAQVIQGGQNTRLHLILVDDNGGTTYSWIDGNTNGTVTTNIYASGQVPTAAENISCSPWWRPNRAAFVLPADVTFAPVQ